jgi:hypothetical protein
MTLGRLGATGARHCDEETWRALARPVAQFRCVVEELVLVTKVLQTMAQTTGDPRPVVRCATRRHADADVRVLSDKSFDERPTLVRLALHGEVNDVAARGELAEYGVEVAEIGEPPPEKQNPHRRPRILVATP